MSVNARLTLVLGGARSGKSAYAEGLITALPPPWFYVATAEALDDEMRARIDAHRARRSADWRVLEAPHALAQTLAQAPQEAPLLIDCLTLWISNRLLAGADLATERAELVEALRARTGPTVAVSAEVGLSIVPENALARSFRDAAGELHQAVAQAAGRVVLTVAGCALVAKG
jgi:adenosylcobinamide kinase/adenosylcobinamide-phosphate guanylyltransferase